MANGIFTLVWKVCAFLAGFVGLIVTFALTVIDGSIFTRRSAKAVEDLAKGRSNEQNCRPSTLT